MCMDSNLVHGFEYCMVESAKIHTPCEPWKASNAQTLVAREMPKPNSILNHKTSMHSPGFRDVCYHSLIPNQNGNRFYSPVAQDVYLLVMDSTYVSLFHIHGNE